MCWGHPLPKARLSPTLGHKLKIRQTICIYQQEATVSNSYNIATYRRGFQLHDALSWLPFSFHQTSPEKLKKNQHISVDISPPFLFPLNVMI